MIAAVIAAAARTQRPGGRERDTAQIIISVPHAAREYSFVILQNGGRIDAGTASTK